MATLEEKIKALLEGSDPSALEEKEVIKTKNGTTIEDDDDKDTEDKGEEDDDHSEPDDDNNGGESDGDEDNEDGAPTDGKTKVSKDPGQEDDQDNPKVNEGIDPFSTKLNGATFDEAGSNGSDNGKTAKLKVGMGRKDGDQSYKLAPPPSSGAKDDNGDNARITAKKSGSTEKGGKLSDGKTSTGGQESSNAKNNVDSNPQGGTKDGFGSMTKNEHMEAMFSGEELSEEFKTKASTIFEAAVAAAAEQRIAELQEETQQQINEAVEEVKAELVEQIDGFLNLMVEQWMDDNAVALEGSMKVELSNSFIDGLKGLFKEHYFDIPEDAIDIVEEQAKEIAELQAAAEEAQTVAKSMFEELLTLKTASIVEQVGDELTKTEKAKFVTLAEKVEYTSDEEYREKLQTIKESYFPATKQVSPIPQDDTPAVLTEESRKAVDSYVDAIAKNLKF